MLPVPYDVLARDLAAFIPENRLVSDPLRTLVYGTDASFYRLVPKLVVITQNESEVVRCLKLCRDAGVSVTFRAAGTSLSGQAVSDSVLLVLGEGWQGWHISPDAATIRLQPGVIGAEANRRLASFGRKIGPDPASINSAKIGGIAANNASGMCCGTAQNSYRTMASMRIVLADGAVVDTGDAASREAFARSHPHMLARLTELSGRTRANSDLAERIRRKFKIKNTTGYSLNALVDFEDPFQILEHLMIGSEGTLGFISEITYRTVPEHAHKASALLMFAEIGEACRAIVRLRQAPVAAAELMDRPALRSVEDKPGMPSYIKELADGVTALLVETRAEDAATLAGNVAEVTAALDGMTMLFPAEFTSDAEDCARFWNIRKGLFPAVGAVRKTGTTVIIEDVAFPVEHLAEATLALQKLLIDFGYPEAIIFGHALEGNLHFVFTQDFNTAAEVARYEGFMEAVCRLVVDGYDGSLKAEHGTGRNMAPFVEKEWGRDAYGLMREIKALLDPDVMLNPGVILNDDPGAHVKNLKPLPAADAIVDKCIECGFCERMCPSQGLTLTPRQRIVGWREISRLDAIGDTVQRDALSAIYDYQGIDTCAACGLCSTACPVAIDTGRLTKSLRARRRGEGARKTGDWLARHFGLATLAIRQSLRMARVSRKLLGGRTLETLSCKLRKATGHKVPVALPTLPGPVDFQPHAAQSQGAGKPKVVYVPSCASRTMGPGDADGDDRALPEVTEQVLAKAGFEVIYPRNLSTLCCGMAFESKGLMAAAATKAAEMQDALDEASQGGKLPVVMDTSPCALRMKGLLPDHLKMQDITEFLHDAVLPRLEMRQGDEPVVVHVTCSTRRMGLDGKLTALAKACSSKVIVPEDVGCCGFAGDKGFSEPELNAHALRHLKEQLPSGCSGVSTSRTCEIGLSYHGGITYRSIVHLIDRCSTPRQG